MQSTALYAQNQIRDVMLDAWWLVLLRGIAAVILGFAALLFPAETRITFAYVLGIYIFVDGLLTIIAAAMDTSDVNWGVVALRGGIGLLTGILVFAVPALFSAVTGLYILLLIAAFAIFSGIIDVFSAWRLRREIDNEVMIIVGGMLSLLLGILIVASPFVFGLAVVSAIGAMAIVFGGTLIALAFRIRNQRTEA